MYPGERDLTNIFKPNTEINGNNRLKSINILTETPDTNRVESPDTNGVCANDAV